MTDVTDSGTTPDRCAVGDGAPTAADSAVPVSPTTPAERRWAFRILFASLTCIGMGQTVIFAVLPPASRVLGYTEFQVGAIFMVSGLFWVLMSPFWGRRSDHWGRKTVILTGLSAFAVSTLLFSGLLWAGLAGMVASAAIYPFLVMSRVVYGTIGPGAMSAGSAYVADRTTRAERTAALATIGAAFGLGTLIGPTLAMFLSFAGLVVPLLFVGVLAVLSALLIWWFLPERTPPKERPVIPVLKMWDPRVRFHLVYATLTNTGHAIPIQMIGFYIIDVLAFSEEQAVGATGIGLLSLSIAGLLAQLVLVPRLRWSPPLFMSAGLWLTVAAFLMFVAVADFTVLVCALGLMGLAGGFSRAGVMSMASLNVGPHEQGGVAGLMSASGGAGFVVGPLAGFLLYSLSPLAPFAMIAVVLFLLGITMALRPTMIAASDQE